MLNRVKACKMKLDLPVKLGESSSVILFVGITNFMRDVLSDLNNSTRAAN